MQRRETSVGRFGLAAAAALVAALAHAEVPQLDRVRVVEPARAIADAAFTDEEGRATRLRDLRGKVVFVLFGFTNCADVCPLTMERLGQFRDGSGLNAADVAYVMISVDGERDTPAVMKEFLARYPRRIHRPHRAAESSDAGCRRNSRRRSSKVLTTRMATTMWRTRRRSSCSTPPAIFAQSCSAPRSSR